jgi:hypothetical protein
MTAFQNGYWRIQTNGIGCCGAGMAPRQPAAFNTLSRKGIMRTYFQFGAARDPATALLRLTRNNA